MKEIINERRDIEGITFYIIVFKLHKSYLLLVSDQEKMGIGSVTLGSPPTVEGLKSTVASYNLFGIGKKLLSTIITERASHLLKAPVLLMLFIKNKKKEEDLAKPLINFMNEAINKRKEQLE